MIWTINWPANVTDDKINIGATNSINILKG